MEGTALGGCGVLSPPLPPPHSQGRGEEEEGLQPLGCSQPNHRLAGSSWCWRREKGQVTSSLSTPMPNCENEGYYSKLTPSGRAGPGAAGAQPPAPAGASSSIQGT